MANNLFRALQAAGYEVIENPTSGAEQQNFTLYIRNQASGNNRSLTITRQPGETNGVIHLTGINQNNASAINVGDPESAVNVCLAAPIAISCAEAIGSSGDLQITGNWDVEIDGVIVQTNISADDVIALFDAQSDFAVSHPLPLPGYRVWISSSDNDFAGGGVNLVDWQWIVCIDGIDIGPVQLNYLSDGGYNNNQLFEDLGLTFTTDGRNNPDELPPNGYRIGLLSNLSPNRYTIRFRVNPQNEDYVGSDPVAYYGLHPLLVSGLDPQRSQRSLATPASYVAHSDGFEVTLEPYPY